MERDLRSEIIAHMAKLMEGGQTASSQPDPNLDFGAPNPTDASSLRCADGCAPVRRCLLCHSDAAVCRKCGVCDDCGMRDKRVEQPEQARWLVFDSSDDFSSHCWLAYLQCLQERGECDMSAPCIGFTFDAAQDAAPQLGPEVTAALTRQARVREYRREIRDGDRTVVPSKPA